MPQNVVFNGTTYAIPLAGELNWSSLSNFLIDVGTNAAVDTDQKQSIRVAVATPIVVAATTDYAVFSNLTVPGAVAVTLPAGINGQIFVLGDGKGDALTNNITITPNGAQTINGASTLVLNKAYQVAILQYHLGSTDWKIQLLSIPPGTLVNADISSAAAIARAKIAAGTASQVVVNDGAGLLSSAATLATSMGGTGQNSTAVFPTSGNVTTDSNTQTLTHKSYDAAGTGNVLANVVDSNIASGAAIARAKIAAGSINQVIINDGAGVLSSEAQLAATRGGTGISSTATFPASGVIVTEAATETLTNKTLTAPIVSDFEVLTEIATPANPAAGKVKVYAKNDDKVYSLTSGGVETALGAGSGVTTMAAFGSTPNANGATITGSNLELEPADATHPGGISTASQVIPGTKEFLAGNFVTMATGADANTTLTASDKRVQQVTPTAMRVYTLPTTFPAGDCFEIANLAPAGTQTDKRIFVRAGDATDISQVYANGSVKYYAKIANPATFSDWREVRQDDENWYDYAPTAEMGGVSVSANFTFSQARWRRKQNYVTVKIYGTWTIANAQAGDFNMGLPIPSRFAAGAGGFNDALGAHGFYRNGGGAVLYPVGINLAGGATQSKTAFFSLRRLADPTYYGTGDGNLNSGPWGTLNDTLTADFAYESTNA